MKFSKTLILFAALAWGLFGCSTEVAGGSSEETNTIAGTLKLPGGGAAARVAVEARSTSNEESVFADTTDERGEFSIAVRSSGTYGVSAVADSLAFYDTVFVFGKKVLRDGTLSLSDSIFGRVFLRMGVPAEQATVKIAGSPWKAASDSNGYFVLKGVPASDFSLTVLSPAPSYVLHSSVAVSAGDLSAAAKDSLSSGWEIVLPLSPDYAVAGLWSFDFASDGYSADTKGRSGKAKLYGNASLSDGLAGTKALRLESSSDFAVVEDDAGVLDSAKEFSVEAWVKLFDRDSGAFIENIFGKLGFSDSAVFSLALVNDTCGVSGEAFAFFLAGPGDSLRCEAAALATGAGAPDGWNYVAASWDGDSAKIFVNGVRAGAFETDFESLVGENGIPLYFGKGNLNLILEDVRISTVALEETDALYRYGMGGVE